MSVSSTWHPARGAALAPGHPLALARTGSRTGRWALLAVAAAIVVAAAWWVTNSPVFDLRNLAVDGAQHLSVQQVTRLSGLTDHSNVMWLARGAVERRLEADPWVLRATVTRHLPSGITISVVERAPVAVTGGPRPMLVAADGVVLGPAPSPADLPTLPSPSTGLRTGDRMAASAELAAAGSLPPGVRRQVATIVRDADGAMVLLTRGGLTVLYGDATQVRAKAEALDAVLAWADRHGLHPAYIDVRAPAYPSLGTEPIAALTPSG